MGEFSLINRYFRALDIARINEELILGIGDDAAISTIPHGQQLVSCVDTLVQGRHFPLNTSAHAIGWKSVAVNLSDLAAMGARPHAILLGLSLPRDDTNWVAEFSEGLAACCRRYGVVLAGGDTTQSPILSISITALGWVPPGQAILRSGANVGDLIVVSNLIGSAAYALAYHQSQLQHALDYPYPQIELGTNLLGYASSMIDISDGLAQDLSHILAASHVGARIDCFAIPVALPLHELDLTQRMRYVLGGGDDYQLCFTINPVQFEIFQQKFDYSLTVIGTIESELGLRFYSDDNTRFYPDTTGYQHFRTCDDE